MKDLAEAGSGEVALAATWEPQEAAAELQDGSKLFYRRWNADPPRQRALILFHRGHEHSGRFQDVVEELGMDDASIFAWDARGHGRSDGERGYAPSFAQMVKDVNHFVSHVCSTYGFAMSDIVVLAHSVGAVTAATWVHDFAPRIRALVLCTPALRVKLYVPFAKQALAALERLQPRRKHFVKSYVKAKMLTHDPEQAERYHGDPLISRAIAVNVLLGMDRAATRLMADAGAIRVPTLVLSGGADWVVRVDAQRTFFEALGSPVKEMQVFDGLYHDILHERDRGPVLGAIRSFVRRAFDQFSPPPPLTAADRGGFTADEFARLRQPLPALSARRAAYAAQRLGMNTLGKLSAGIQLGSERGFDSGESLDYVYENKPRGRLGIGKLIDRGYLDAIGWKGIRQRRIHLEAVLAGAIGRLREEGREIRLLDIATGCGRYVLETLRQTGSSDVRAVLRDYREANLQRARETGANLGVESVEFVKADAFDEEDLAALDPPPNLAIVSGLYELFPENDPVRRSLRGLSRAMKPGGYLIYTNQPWHPQVEMIARTLTNREGAPWIMRRRTQEEMDDLIREAGFDKVSMEIDEFGIFTVSLARRA